MSVATTQAQPARLGATARSDAWWVAPVATAVSLAILGIYATVVVLLGSDYLVTEDGAHYLSPFYSPDLGGMFGWDPPFSTALLVVWAPLGLRITCYYYRKAYYRAFFLSPPACAVGSRPQRRYRGEAKFPWILQNIHRYFLYFALIVLAFLVYDSLRAFFFRADDGSLEFGLGLGSVVLLLNAIFLVGFTFGCNSLRHLVGGHTDCFTCSARARARHKAWRFVTKVNAFHREWAWVSLVWVCLADLYVRLVAAGVFDDPRLF
jgi:hypothetical protein